jgi:hypothetical protein
VSFAPRWFNIIDVAFFITGGQIMAAMSEPRRLTWGRSALYASLVFIVCAALAQWKPIWIAPPNHASTGWVYQLVLLLWIPVLVACARRRPAGERGWGWLCAIGLALLTLVMSALIWITFSFAPRGEECTQAAASLGPVVYTCSTSLFESRLTMTFEGPPGSPLVRWTGNELQSFGG